MMTAKGCDLHHDGRFLVRGFGTNLTAIARRRAKVAERDVQWLGKSFGGIASILNPSRLHASCNLGGACPEWGDVTVVSRRTRQVRLLSFSFSFLRAAERLSFALPSGN